MTLKIEREIATDNGMQLTHPSHLSVNKKTNIGSVLTERIHTKIVGRGNGFIFRFMDKGIRSRN